MLLPPPCDRLWVGLEAEPAMELATEVRMSSGEVVKEGSRDAAREKDGSGTFSRMVVFFIKKEIITNAFMLPSLQGLPVPTLRRPKETPLLSLAGVPGATEQYRRCKKLFRTLHRKEPRAEAALEQ